MLIYADPKTSATVEQAMLGLDGLQGRDLLIARGMLEQGLADADLNDREAPPKTKIELKTPEGFAFYQFTRNSIAAPRKNGCANASLRIFNRNWDTKHWNYSEPRCLGGVKKRWR